MKSYAPFNGPYLPWIAVPGSVLLFDPEMGPAGGECELPTLLSATPALAPVILGEKLHLAYNLYLVFSSS